MSGSHSSGPVSTNGFTVDALGRDAGVVHEDVDRAGRRATIRGTASRSVTSATTGWAAPPSASISRDDLLGAVAVQVVDPHLGAGPGELDRRSRDRRPRRAPVTTAARPAMKFDQSRIVATAGLRPP